MPTRNIGPIFKTEARGVDYGTLPTANDGSIGTNLVAWNKFKVLLDRSVNSGNRINNNGIGGVVSTYSLVYTVTGAYAGGVLAPNGDIHFIPNSANRGQKISAGGVVSTYSLVYTIAGAYLGGVLAPNGDIHFIPGSAAVGQKISAAGVVSTYSLAYTAANAYRGGVLAPNGEIHVVPFSGNVGQRIITSASSWTPANLSTSSELWLDASDSSTITLNGSQVSQWKDKSGNARHVSNGNSASQPTYSATGLNNLPTITAVKRKFLQTNGNTSGFSGGSSLWAIAVATMTSDTDSFGRLISYDQQGSLDYNQSDLTSLILRLPNTTENIGTFRDGGPRATRAITYNTPMLFGIVYDGSNSTAYVNGTPGTAVASSGNFTNAPRITVFAFGANPDDGAGAWDGRCSEIIIGDTSLSTQDRQLIEGYLAHKWGLVSGLPVDHPYKSTAPTLGNITSTYSLVYTTTTAYVGGVLAPNGDIHFVPRAAAVGQKISTAGVVSTYSLVYTTSSAYSAGVLAPNGDIHFIPSSAAVGQKISAAGVVSTYSLAYTTAGGYFGGVLAPNGDIHFVPIGSAIGQKISSAGVVSTYSLAYTTASSYLGGILNTNGDIHFIPSNAGVGQEITIDSGVPFSRAMCLSPWFNKV